MTCASHPSHFAQAQAFVGMPYVPGQFDCADLAVRVQRDIFGHAIALPAHGHTRQAQGAQIQALRLDLAQPVDAPHTGCAVVLTRGDSAGTLWHIGTVFVDSLQTWVLHNSQHLRSAALQRLDWLQRTGFVVEGYYKWK
jgi:hypothetical protein